MRFREVRERKEVERRFDTSFDPDRRINTHQQNNNTNTSSSNFDPDKRIVIGDETKLNREV